MEEAAPDKPGIRLPPPELPEETRAAEATGSLSGHGLAGTRERQAEEVDVWYGAYAGRATLPRLIQLLLLSSLIIVLAWSLGAWRGVNAARYTALAVIAALWFVQAVSWLIYAIGLSYRLTTRRLFYQFGFRHPGQPGIALTRITQVSVEANRLEHWLDVGRLRIFVDQGPPLVLDGVRHPFHVARQIERRRRA